MIIVLKILSFLSKTFGFLLKHKTIALGVIVTAIVAGFLIDAKMKLGKERSNNADLQSQLKVAHQVRQMLELQRTDLQNDTVRYRSDIRSFKIALDQLKNKDPDKGKGLETKYPDINQIKKSRK